MDAGYPKTIGIANWGLKQIDATFTLGNHLYLFASDRYFKLAPAQELTRSASRNAMAGKNSFTVRSM